MNKIRKTILFGCLLCFVWAKNDGQVGTEYTLLYISQAMEKKYEGVILYRFKQDITPTFQELVKTYTRDSSLFFRKAGELRDMVKNVNWDDTWVVGPEPSLPRTASKKDRLAFLNSILDNRFHEDFFIEEIAFMETRRTCEFDKQSWSNPSPLILVRDSLVTKRRRWSSQADSLLFGREELATYENLLNKRQSPYSKMKKVPGQTISRIFESIDPLGDDKFGVKIKEYFGRHNDAVYFVLPI